jgi:hypothetical protein
VLDAQFVGHLVDAHLLGGHCHVARILEDDLKGEVRVDGRAGCARKSAEGEEIRHSEARKEKKETIVPTMWGYAVASSGVVLPKRVGSRP